MAGWKNYIKKSISDPKDLPSYLSCDNEQLDKVHRVYPMRINSYYLNLMKNSGQELRKQAIPDIRELQDREGMIDPLGEENLSPVPNLVHKYPDRALFLVTNQCALYCRFCTRKRKVGKAEMLINDDTISKGIRYLRQNNQIREVLVSGGDPLMLEDSKLEQILRALRKIKSIEVIRIGTRIPCTLPMRITTHLVKMLKKYHPLYINTHFNHPAEITEESSRACKRLADAGIPLGNQSVLLRGINDSPEVMRELLCGLLQIRVKPYYLFQADLTAGTSHFRTSIDKGISLMQSLIGHVSGMAIPTYALDLPDGGGKVPLTPDYLCSVGAKMHFQNYCGHQYAYPNHECSFEQTNPAK